MSTIISMRIKKQINKLIRTFFFISKNVVDNYMKLLEPSEYFSSKISALVSITTIENAGFSSESDEFSFKQIRFFFFLVFI